MPAYQYRAARQNGKSVKGTAQAADPAALRADLREQGIFLISCEETKDKRDTKKMKAKQLAEFCRELGMMISSGVPLIRAISIMAQRDVKPQVKKVYTDLYRDLQKGMMLSEAMAAQGNVFPDLLINMYKASESTGGMDVTSKKMAAHFEKMHKINQKAVSAAVYPIILLVVTLVVLLVVFLAVLPKFFELYEDMDAPMPAITQFMLGLSKGIQSHWLVILIVILVLILVIKGLIAQPKVKAVLDRKKLGIPIVGKLLRTIYTSRFARTLSSSYSSGISMINALENTRDTIGNSYIAGQFDQLISDVREGQPLSASIGKIQGIDNKLPASILIGEETGRLDSMLESIADTFDYDAEIALQRMTTLMEPVMIILMAIVIGSVMISVMLPLPTLYNAIGSGA